MGYGSTILTTDDVLPGVAAMIPILQVEGDVRRRHQARHGARTDPPDRRRAPPIRSNPARSPPPTATSNSTPAARARAERRQHRRPAGAGRLALSFLRSQPRARVRSRRRLSACGSTSPPAPRCGSSPASARKSRSSPSAAAGIDRAEQPDAGRQHSTIAGRARRRSPAPAPPASAALRNRQWPRFPGATTPRCTARPPATRVRLGDTSLIAVIET